MKAVAVLELNNSKISWNELLHIWHSLLSMTLSTVLHVRMQNVDHSKDYCHLHLHQSQDSLQATHHQPLLHLPHHHNHQIHWCQMSSKITPFYSTKTICAFLTFCYNIVGMMNNARGVKNYVFLLLIIIAHKVNYQTNLCILRINILIIIKPQWNTPFA